MMTNGFYKLKFLQIFIVACFFSSLVYNQNLDKKEVRRIHARIDRLIVKVDSLEVDNAIVMPRMIETHTESKKKTDQLDSTIIAFYSRMNSVESSMKKLEKKIQGSDSTKNVILNRLLLLENKISTLIKSYNEMANLKSGEPISSEPQFNAAQYREKYTLSLGELQNQNWADAISGFEELVKSDPTNELADNSQYWLAECYYAQNNYKRAIAEFEKVFTFPGTNKDGDAQYKIGLSYKNIGNVKKAKEEFQRLVDYFPGSDYYDKAKEQLKILSLN